MADTPAAKPTRRRTAKAPKADGAAAPTRRTAGKPAPTPVVEAKTEPAKAPRAPRKAPAAKPAAAQPATAKPVAAKTATKKTAKAKEATRPARKPAAPRSKATPVAKPTSSQAAAPTPVQKLVERARDALPEAPPRAGLFAALGTLAAVGGAFFVWRASRVDEPTYQVLESDGAIEIRRYAAMVTAGTEQRGTRQAALNDGFRVLADYIFAKSRKGEKLPMTAPVLSDTSGGGSWRTRFIMPAGKARAGLPAGPAGVELVSEPSARVAAIRFSGRANDDTLETKENVLRSWLQTRSLPSEGRAVHAFYNAPATPGPLRRNEVLIVLSEDGGMG